MQPLWSVGGLEQGRRFNTCGVVFKRVLRCGLRPQLQYVGWGHGFLRGCCPPNPASARMGQEVARWGGEDHNRSQLCNGIARGCSAVTVSCTDSGGTDNQLLRLHASVHCLVHWGAAVVGAEPSTDGAHEALFTCLWGQLQLSTAVLCPRKAYGWCSSLAPCPAVPIGMWCYGWG